MGEIREMNLYVDNLPERICIGHQGTQGAIAIRFNVAGWLKKWPNGVFDINIQRHGEYQVQYSRSATPENGIITWVPDATDTAVIGVGHYEIEIKREANAKDNYTSAVGEFMVLERVGGDQINPPDPYIPWITKLNQTIAKSEALNAQNEQALKNMENVIAAAEQANATIAQGIVDYSQLKADAVAGENVNAVFDHSTNTMHFTLAPGPQGPKGDIGPQGPAGKSGIISDASHATIWTNNYPATIYARNISQDNKPVSTCEIRITKPASGPNKLNLKIIYENGADKIIPLDNGMTSQTKTWFYILLVDIGGWAGAWWTYSMESVSNNNMRKLVFDTAQFNEIKTQNIKSFELTSADASNPNIPADTIITIYSPYNLDE